MKNFLEPEPLEKKSYLPFNKILENLEKIQKENGLLDVESFEEASEKNSNTWKQM